MEPSPDMFRAPSSGVGGGPGPSSSSSSSLLSSSSSSSSISPLSSSNSRRFGALSPFNIINAPLSLLLEYSGILRTTTNARSHHNHNHHHQQLNPNPNSESSPNDGEVSIRIIGPSEHEHHNHHREESQPSSSSSSSSSGAGGGGGLVVGLSRNEGMGMINDEGVNGAVAGDSGGIGIGNGNENSDAEAGGDGVGGGGANGRDSSYQRYDIQHAARWVEQVLPFSLLLLVVFIRQHLQGFFVTIWIAAVLFKSNDILRKQTALKGERKIPVLIGISVAFSLQVVGVYWWYQNDDLMYPLVMLPPREIPPFWHAIFIIMVNDTLVRQAAMVFKCILLMYYKNSRGRNYRRQGQMLTLVEYLLLLYRALLPTPVWYRFFLNKEYGSLFSSLMTGLYLTFKLTSVVEKVQSFFAAVKALSRKEVHYGAYATSEQVNAAGDLCAICQEKMHAPILLRCKHIFCEDCVSEWFERERTCPLCRALVKPADLRSFGDGSTSLFFQLF